MNQPAELSWQTVEFHRFGDANSVLLSSSGRYIRATGWDQPAMELSPTLDHEALMRALGRLRYRGSTTEALRGQALQLLADEAVRFLPPLSPGKGELLQVDIVSNAAELWPLPFEALYVAQPAALRDAQGVVITRRVRGGFEATMQPWPEQPHLLFAHAAIDADLGRTLVDEHLGALRHALAPWGDSTNDLAKVLTVREVDSPAALAAACVEAKPTYVHLLAHGALVQPDPELPEQRVWGVRLGVRGVPGVPPARIAQALRLGSQPVVATLAVCDSANQADVQFASRSLAQELHQAGLPVVLGSQFPLTHDGSVTMARAFYDRLLVGDDVRRAVHDARVALRAQPKAGHDWLSLVAYVRLPPEGYAQHLESFALRVKLAMLDSAQAAAGRLTASAEAALPQAYDGLVQRLREHIVHLEGMRGRVAERQLDEWHGLLGSSCKRLAELLFRRAAACGPAAAGDVDESRRMLVLAQGHYAAGYARAPHSHWLGVQTLSLAAVLEGACSAHDWPLVARLAERSRDIAATDVWSCGTLAELYLLAPLAGQPARLDDAVLALRTLVERVPRDPKNAYAVKSTRQQLQRYLTWWTGSQGFFAGGTDLSDGAQRLSDALAEAARSLPVCY